MRAKTVAIPTWDPQGVIPPISSADPTSHQRSPYRVSLVDFVLRFGNTATRWDILSGFLYFRCALRKTGFVEGFQWIDGSFLENIETIESRDPNDIDVVTCFHLPEGKTQQTLQQDAPRLFDPSVTKNDYRVHAYYVQLNSDIPESVIDQTTYWYSLWSHTRNGRWKGYVQIDLFPADDQTARANLNAISNEGGEP